MVYSIHIDFVGTVKFVGAYWHEASSLPGWSSYPSTFLLGILVKVKPAWLLSYRTSKCYLLSFSGLNSVDVENWRLDHLEHGQFNMRDWRIWSLFWTAYTAVVPCVGQFDIGQWAHQVHGAALGLRANHFRTALQCRFMSAPQATSVLGSMDRVTFDVEDSGKETKWEIVRFLDPLLIAKELQHILNWKRYNVFWDLVVSGHNRSMELLWLVCVFICVTSNTDGPKKRWVFV